MNHIADLQLHSKYARAVSPQMVIPQMWMWGKRKGTELLATADWTHPLWMRELKEHLVERGDGLLELKPSHWEGNKKGDGPYFLLATEVSSIYSQGGKLRRIHTLIWSPSFETSDKIIQELTRRGAKLMSDGRPIIGLSSIEVAELVLTIDPSCLVIPAHVWTPWFALYGSQSGFDSIDECFGPYAKYIYGIETGLSSDPSMNWRIKELDNRRILSFSDAHSGPKMAREATVFDLQDLSYSSIRKAIVGGDAKNRVAYTIEFFPEEGKYHFSGHRLCGVKQDPSQTNIKGSICPVCGKKLTIGVMHRVEELAGRSEADLALYKDNVGDTLVKGTFSKTFPDRPPYIKIVPLQEILSESLNSPVTGVKVQTEYMRLVTQFGGEFNVLLKTENDKIKSFSGERTMEAIHKVRTGDIVVDPGYDGVFGIVKIWGDEKKEERKPVEKSQLSFF